MTPTEQLLEQLGKAIEGLQQDKEQIAKEAWELKEVYDTLRAELEQLKRYQPDGPGNVIDTQDGSVYGVGDLAQALRDLATLRAERDELAVLCKQQNGQIKHMHGRQRTMLGWIRDYKAERDEAVRALELMASGFKKYNIIEDDCPCAICECARILTRIKGETT